MIAAVVAARSAFIFFTERGVANEIKGFVLMLIARGAAASAAACCGNCARSGARWNRTDSK